MNLETTSCDCCEEQTHHLSLPLENITYDGQDLELHITDDELNQLYMLLKEVQCQ